MAREIGKIVLMGSGELTATMVDVHKALLAGSAKSGKAVFLDTPAGFQLNVDQISQRAVEYFQKQIQHPLSIASYKSRETTSTLDAEQAFHILREADYTLIGPGSPSYAISQWLHTPIPKIFIENIQSGSCLVAASAAALTVGRYTLPVYEIYKVGQDLHWVEAMDILGAFGLNLVVIPHWNNAEGGTHDTRRCFMGEERFNMLATLLPDDVSILGLDEHTACIIDLKREAVEVRGIGRMVLRHGDNERAFKKGDIFPIDVLRLVDIETDLMPSAQQDSSSVKQHDQTEKAAFWDNIHQIERSFQKGLDKGDATEVINALLDLDQSIWQALQDRENEEFISQAREMLREFIVLMGTVLVPSSAGLKESMAMMVDELLLLREGFRQKKLWYEADMIRDSLHRAGIVIEDTKNGSRWRFDE